jgi:ABC-type multidrug transport system fused ATPase/permease subunit
MPGRRIPIDHPWRGRRALDIDLAITTVVIVPVMPFRVSWRLPAVISVILVISFIPFVAVIVSAMTGSIGRRQNRQQQ